MKDGKQQKPFATIQELGLDLFINAVDLFNPTVWMSPETMLAAISSVGRNFIKGRLKGLLDEIRNKTEEGKIDEETLNSEKTTRSILDLAKFLGEKNPDEETWDAAKKIFKHALHKDITEEERSSLYDMLDICKQLSGSEIRILAGAHQILNNPQEATRNQRQSDWWAGKVAENIGFAAKEQVLRFEDNLMRLQLIAPREILSGSTLDTWRGGGGASEHRLTELGRKLAELLSE
ncbi:hypothetical protein KW798_00005 [Candidatus Parcubacteria bacterium]|nr:hypothetical protein [Candidatus Parcubacteria bacterium]